MTNKYSNNINEGYSAYPYANVVENTADMIVDACENLMRGNTKGWKATNQTNTEYAINIVMSLSKNVNVMVNVRFLFTERLNGTPKGFYDATTDMIHVNLIPSTCKYEIIRDVLLHELTHKFDDMRFFGMEDDNTTPYKYHYHGDIQNGFFPNSIKRLLYILWDTHEFNAWQASVRQLKGGVKQLYSYIVECEKINDPGIWAKVGEYLTNKQDKENDLWGGESNKFNNRGPEWVKRYFIRVSKDRFEKFRKKYVRMQTRDFVNESIAIIETLINKNII